jgi:glycosyltransferase involved in cell wall biosynthesis
VVITARGSDVNLLPHFAFPRTMILWAATRVAAHALVLVSGRECRLTVFLESMACGTPVVVADASGIPKIVVAPDAGVAIVERSVQSMAQALESLFQNCPDRSLTWRYAKQDRWDYTTCGQMSLFDRIRGGAG